MFVLPSLSEPHQPPRHSALVGAERRREITAQELGAILSGIDLTQASRRKRYGKSV
jgi:hypothetical protein